MIRILEIANKDRNRFRELVKIWISAGESIAIEELFDLIAADIISKMEFSQGSVSERAIYKVGQYDFVKELKSRIIDLAGLDQDPENKLLELYGETINGE